MNHVDLTEAGSVLTTVLTALQATLKGTGGLVSQARYLCGALVTNGEAELSAGGSQFWIDLATCFESAQQAGVTFDDMDTLRVAIDALTPSGLPAIAVRNFSVRMALAEQARILAATTFTSRQDIDRYIARINAAFDAAELIAADNLDNVAYVALVNIHGAVTNDLMNRARPLARMVSYSFPSSMPSLWLAQTLYQDASRNDELVAENKVIHPLFMPNTGNALAD